jgi:hypothetical protein
MLHKQVKELFTEIFPFILALASAAGGLISYAFATFETKELSKERHTALDGRLERIENKIDQILMRP